jgi:FkbM family methyltransferase
MSENDMYHSQVGQDKYLNENVFIFKENGFFVEVGASDGVKLSNTLFFEESMGWNGICIEPNPSAYRDLCINRECVAYDCAVDIEDGQVEFTKNVGYTEQLSGITKYYDPRQVNRIAEWVDGNADDGGIVPNSGSSEVIQVKSRRLSSIFHECQVTEVDYLSIDVEGAELPVIQSIDFDEVFVHVIGFEANWRESAPPVIEYLSHHGFEHLANVSHDVFMINQKSEYKR